MVHGWARPRRFTAVAQGLLTLPHVQLWETENSWRLDRSHRGSHRRDIPGLVDASGVRTVNVCGAFYRRALIESRCNISEAEVVVHSCAKVQFYCIDQRYEPRKQRLVCRMLNISLQ